MSISMGSLANCRQRISKAIAVHNHIRKVIFEVDVDVTRKELEN